MTLKPCSLKQQRMLENESDVLVLGGSAGSSKSWMLHMIACKYLDCPNFKATFIRRTTPQLMKPGNLWDTGKKVFGQLNIVNNINYRPRWTQGDQKLVRWGHGPVIEYSHCQHVKDLDNYQGSQMTGFYIDEAIQLEWEMLTYFFSRMRSDSKYPSRMVMSCNPDPDHMLRTLINWWIDEDGYAIEERLGIERYFYVVDDFPQVASTAEELIEKFPHMAEGPDGMVVQPMSLSFIASKITDNPILLKNNPRYLSALKGLKEIERKQLLEGNWDVRPSGANYFKREDLKKAQSIPLTATCCRSWDKASTQIHDRNRYPDFSACIKMYKDRDGEFFIAGEFHHDNYDRTLKDIFGKFREKPGLRDRIILKQARYDTTNCPVILPCDPGAHGQTEFIDSAKKLTSEGFTVKKDPATTNSSKLQKFSPFASAVENQFVSIVESTFPNKATLDEFYKELESFDGEGSGKLVHDDVVDACGTAFNYLNQTRNVPIVCRNQKENPTKTKKVIEARHV